MIIFSRFGSVRPVFRLINISQLLHRRKHCKDKEKDQKQSKDQKQTKDLKRDPCTERPKPMIDFNCKVALITGGAEGIGLATAHELLSEKIQSVALTGTDNCAGREAVNCLNCTYGKNKAIFINCDMQCKVQICECYEKVLKEFGKLDILVTADTIFNGINWEREINHNLMGTIHNMHHAFKIMGKDSGGNGGVILTVSGLHGIKPLPPGPTFSASLFGIVGLSRSFGDMNNFHKTGIRVVTLCPGFTNTKQFKAIHEKAFNVDMRKQLEILLAKAKRQNPDVCGKSALHVLKYGVSGSVWVVDGSKLYSLNIPKWKKYRVLESQLM